VFKPAQLLRASSGMEVGWFRLLIFEPRAAWGQGFSLWCFPDG
jgi:hypothetical protein